MSWRDLRLARYVKLLGIKILYHFVICRRWRLIETNEGDLRDPTVWDIAGRAEEETSKVIARYCKIHL